MDNKYISKNMQDIQVKPYRVLVVIGDQWTDPQSYNIDSKRVRGKDFIDVTTMLKIWGIPFDVLRLDQQRLQINRFLDGAIKPNYGCVIWMADPNKLEGYSAHYQTLRRAVEEYGISMIALFDYIKTKEVADLIGVKYDGIKEVLENEIKDSMVISKEHYITSDLVGTVLPDKSLIEKSQIEPPFIGTYSFYEKEKEEPAAFRIVECTATDEVSVLGSIGEYPQLVSRDLSDNTKVIWIGGNKDWFRKYKAMRSLFRKSLVYAMGYGLFNDNFDNGFIFIMDDAGSSENAWSLRWHYPTPSKETLIKYLIEPLEKNGLMMVQNVTSGYANPKTQMIEVPWSIKPFRDIFGNWQDYGSTKEGLDEGIRRGVFEIQCHRVWTHMNWDLDSPPGPWWTSTVDGEMDVTEWYNEIVDLRRGGTPVPSNDMLFLYKTGIDAIKKAFGVVPLAAEVRLAAEMKPGTKGAEDNGRVAAIAGLGLSRECYVGTDRIIELSMMMPEILTCHDLDLAAKTDAPGDTSDAGWHTLSSLSTEQLVSSKVAGGRRINLLDNTDWIESRKDKDWMGFNECCAYLHTVIKNIEKDKFNIELDYDNHYCNYFEERPSFWTLELADRMIGMNGTKITVIIDGNKKKTFTGNKYIIEIPAGTGKHTIQIH